MLNINIHAIFAVLTTIKICDLPFFLKFVNYTLYERDITLQMRSQKYEIHVNIEYYVFFLHCILYLCMRYYVCEPCNIQ